MELKQLHSGNKAIFSGFAESRTGGRKENQDSYGFKQMERGFLMTICDGMGGGPGGKTASDIAVKEIIGGIEEANRDEEIPNIIIKAIRRANMAILESGNAHPNLKGMGSTATVLLLSKHSAFVAHVGDSRVYQLRGKKKLFRTFDHSMVFDLVNQGVITEEQARLSAQSNVITRALGINPDVEVDIQELAYEKGDRFLLCTDGIHGTMPEKELIKMVANKKNSLGAVTDDIATFVDNAGHASGGGHDNLTLAIIEPNINSKLKAKMSKATKLTILVLAVTCVISVALNIVQGTNLSKNRKEVISKEWEQKESLYKSSIKQLNDSILLLNNSIERLNKKSFKQENTK